MAHFAELDENSIVKQVIVVNNNELLDNGVEAEAKGIALCQSLLGGTWVQTSYNNNIRGTYAGIGFTYNAAEDIFISPQPYPSWVRTGSFWNAPIQMPTDGMWSWNEDELSWEELVLPTE
jgi:hypothetical protein